MAKPLEVNLSEQQREELTNVRDHHKKPYMRERAAAVLKGAGPPGEKGQSVRQAALHGLLCVAPPRAVAKAVWPSATMMQGDALRGLTAHSHDRSLDVVP